MLRKNIRKWFKIRTNYSEPFITELEKEQYNLLQKDYRQLNKQIYWEIQGRVENDFIDNYHIEQKKKKRNDEMKLRSNIIIRSFEDFKKLDKKYGNMRRRLDIKKQEYLQEVNNKKLKKQIINILNEESKSWYSNYNSKDFNPKLVAPNIQINQNDYYVRLHEVQLIRKHYQQMKVNQKIMMIIKQIEKHLIQRINIQYHNII